MGTCLLIHGFTGGVFEVAPLSEFLQGRSFRTVTFFLRGLGGSRTELKGASREDWLHAAELQFKKTSGDEAIHLIGFSAGALIAAALAVKYKEQVRSLTLLAAPVYLFNVKEIIKTLGKADMVKNYIKKFLTTPYRATRQFKAMVRESLQVYGKIQVPTLIIQGGADHLVQTRSANYLYEAIQADRKKLLIVDHSGHLICHGEGQESVFQEVFGFIQSENKCPPWG